MSLSSSTLQFTVLYNISSYFNGFNKENQYRSVVSTMNTPSASTQPTSKPKRCKMIPARNPLRRLRRLKDIPEPSSSELSKSVHEETVAVLGKKASTSHFNNAPSASSGRDSRSFTRIDHERKARVQVSDSVETKNIESDSSEDDNVALADVL